MPKKHTVKQVKGELHPRSRKSVQLKRALLRTDRLTTKKAERALLKVNPVVDRMMWFKLILDDDQKALDEESMHDLILLYISRFDEEIEQLRTSLRPNRPLPRRLDELEMARRQNGQEYESAGFQVPDLRDSRTVEALRRWNGEFQSIATIKQVRLIAPKQ